MSDDLLTRELHELGRTMPLAPADTDALTQRVLARLDEARREPAGSVATASPARTRRRRSVAALAVGVLIALLLTPPVRAAVADWFGVIIQSGPPAEEATVPGVAPGLNLDEARSLVEFEPVLPASLGRPDGIDVSPDRQVLSMSWTVDGHTVRLDQFDGSFAPLFLKRGEAEVILLNGRPAAWFNGPHELAALNEYGIEFGAPPRPAGPTLIWEHDDVTLRLEGTDRNRAVEIALELLGTG